MAKNLKPCDPEGEAVQKSFKEQIEEQKLIGRMRGKVNKAKDFLKAAIEPKNHKLFEYVLFFWITPKTLIKYIRMKEWEAAEALRLKAIAEGGGGEGEEPEFVHVASQLPKRNTRYVPNGVVVA
ncbi:unnamed protein product [Phyllotreta striolata]|uniref:Uncharacterized protein n=1 Tax=Phyllotreta striolata TaxID=444603 RepID=A0A9N9TQD8_PHYSR|nr:unnamed protein product [Phyllotreta striolata]